MNTDKEFLAFVSSALNEFARLYPSPRRGLIAKTLKTLIRVNGEGLYTRAEAITRRVASGAVVQSVPNGELRLINTDDTFLDEHAITNTGMMFAKFLIKWYYNS